MIERRQNVFDDDRFAAGAGTLRKRNGDDDSVAGAHPQPLQANHHRRDADERKAQLSCSCFFKILIVNSIF